MARHQQQQRPRRAQRGPALQQRHLLAFAGDRGQHHGRASVWRHCRPRASSSGLGLTSNFRLPQTCTGRRRSCAAAARRPRSAPARRQRAGHRAHQCADALALGLALLDSRALASTIGTAGCGAAQQVGPDLGFHDHADRGPVVAQEAPHRTGRVVGQPALRVAVAQQRRAGLAPGGRAMRQQQPQPRALRAQRVDQRRGGAGLAQRHGMQPQRAGRRRGAPKPRRSARAWR